MAITQKKMLDRCRTIAGGNGKWSFDELHSFLQRFRPDGHGLGGLLADVEHGPEIAARLTTLMQLDGTIGVPLTARKTSKVSNTTAADLVSQFIHDIHQLAAELSEEELEEKLGQIQRLKISVRGVNEFRDNSITGDLTEHICDFVEGLVFETAQQPSCGAYVLAEAIYTLTYDFFLQYYVLWPLVAETVKVNEPFSSYFEMWRRGMKWRVLSNEALEVFVPAPRHL